LVDGSLPPKLETEVPGPRSRRLAARLREVDCPAFEARRQARSDRSRTEQDPIVYAHAKGSNVFDADENRYVDLVAGFGSLALGHAPKAVTRAVAAQQRKLTLALGDVYAAEVKVLLCEQLSRFLPSRGARVMLGLSGADAITAALKSALLATGKPGVVAFRGGYHGLSYAPLAACGLDETFRLPFESQLGKYVSFAPYPTEEGELDRSLKVVRGLLRLGTCGAVLVEPILGRGGCAAPPRTFLSALRAACDEAGSLLVADEIWTGMGRCGAWLATLEQDVVPDIVCVGKALGGGLPISACIGSADVMHAWAAHGGGAIHTATHFASPLACAAAVATIRELRVKRLPARSRSLGERWRRRLAALISEGGIREVTGRGLMVGIHLAGGAGRALAVSRGLLRRGYIVLTGGISGDVLTLTPALTIAEERLTAFVDALADVLRQGV
jgi:4-aminobutyrate aminotransferase/(S)-3-amino-2-methylpropionate transaminase